MNSQRGRGGRGTPAWLIVLIAGAFVFGFFYVVQGVQTFFRTGGLGVQEATQRAFVGETATAVRVTQRATVGFTPQPTFTPPPECIDFRVTTDSGMVRASPSFNGQPVTSIRGGEIVCVLERVGEWYTIDSNTETRRRELAYMHESILEAANPTATPSPTAPATPLPAPTDTPLATATVLRLATVTPAGGAAVQPAGASPTSLPATPNFAQTFSAERTRRALGTQEMPTARMTQTAPSLSPARTLPATLSLLPTASPMPETSPSAPLIPTAPPLQSA